MKQKGKKRRSSESAEQNIKEVSENKKLKTDQLISPKKKKNANILTGETNDEHLNLKKKDKKRKREKSEDLSHSKPSKKLKKSKKSVENNSISTGSLEESKSEKSTAKKSKKKSKKHKKINKSVDEVAKTSSETILKQHKKNKKSDLENEISKEISGMNKSGAEESTSITSKKKKKKKSKQAKKADDLSMNSSASPSNLSLEKLNKKKKKLLEQLEECDKNLKTIDGTPVKKNKKKKSKKLNKSSDSGTTASPEKVMKPIALDSENDFSIPTLSDLEKQAEPKKIRVISTKRKSKHLSKNEFRKEIRQQEGQFFFLNQFSLEEMKEKIVEIQSRDEKSKRALRILRTLKKKVEAAETELKKIDANKSDVNESLSIQNHNKVNTEPKLIVGNTVDTGDMKSAKKNKNTNKTTDELFCFDDNTSNTSVDESEPTSSKNTNKTPVKKLFFEDNPSLSVKVSPKKNKSDQNPPKKLFFEDLPSNNDGDKIEFGMKNSTENHKVDITTAKELFFKDKVANHSDNKTIPESVVSPKNFEKKPATKKLENKVESQGKKQRYVLFVGNLAYDTTTVDLKKHFLTKVSKVVNVRIPLDREKNTPRGIGFVEVENSIDFEKALSLHGTFLENRPLKVEYTTSSKKVDKREIVHKNKKLLAMRKAGMLAGSQKDSQKRSFRRNLKNKPKN